MGDEFRTYTRVNRFEKKRKNTKAISVMLLLGGLLVMAFIAVLIFGPDESDGPAQTVTGQEQEDEESSHTNDPSNDQSTEEQVEPEGSNNGSENDGEVIGVPNDSETEIETVPTDDENVIDAYTGNWEPVATEQQGPHTITFEQESQDWKEMMSAVRLATGLTSDDMIQWWVERDGDQKVIATVSNRAETEIYRTYVTWVENQGWMPTKVERLKENDQKHRFEDQTQQPQDQPETTE